MVLWLVDSFNKFFDDESFLIHTDLFHRRNDLTVFLILNLLLTNNQILQKSDSVILKN